MKKILLIGLLVIGLGGLYWAVQMLQSPGTYSTQTKVLNPDEVIAGVYAQADRWQSVAGVQGEEKRLSSEELYALAMKDLPESLQGTRMDGGFRLDANGRLIVEPQVVRVFEYFMTSIGEDDLETIIARVTNLIEAALPDSAKADAHRLLAQYLDYRQRQGEIQEAAGANLGQNVNGLRETFNQVKQMRRDVFGDANADSLFKDDEAYLDFNLNTMEISQTNPDMTELEQLQSIKNLSTQLPENHRKVVEEQLVQKELDLRTRELQEQGASAEALRQMRESLLGTQAAERLAKLDQKRAQWDQRVQGFKQDYDSQLADLAEDADPTQQQALLQETLQQHGFSEPEKKRVRAILNLY